MSHVAQRLNTVVKASSQGRALDVNLRKALHDLVVHVPAILRVWVQDDREWRIASLDVMIATFEPAFWPGDNDFCHDYLLLKFRCTARS